MKKTYIALFLIFNFSILAFAQQTRGILANEENIIEDLKLNVCEDEQRLEAVKNLFKKMGASDDSIKIEKFKNVENLVVTKKGKTEETIIVGAHYDKTKKGCGVIDNWTGIVIIANLYRTLKQYSTDKTFVFVAFGKEEIGLVGSNAMAKEIPKEKRVNYCSMINFDSFGFNYPQILENTSSPKITKTAKAVAEEMNLKLTAASLEGLADADSSSFLDKDIPAVTFHGLSDDWQKYLHSSNDKPENVNPRSVLIGYLYGFKFLVNIDKSDCGVFRK